jgi:uncharacterized protein YegP (UPF0339 family)
MTFEVYQDESDEWRWRLKAGNSEIIATSSEGYVSKNDCDAGVALVRSCNPFNTRTIYV